MLGVGLVHVEILTFSKIALNTLGQTLMLKWLKRQFSF